jgi:hypothetical protein
LLKKTFKSISDISSHRRIDAPLPPFYYETKNQLYKQEEIPYSGYPETKNANKKARHKPRPCVV